MRHGKKINHLGRQKSHRTSMLSNMAASLIIHKRIFTTTAKAKALRKFVEPLITKSKQDTTHSRRIVFSYLQDKKAVSELFRDISVKIGDRPGGYTRILKSGTRFGDSADMCYIELVDYNQVMLESAERSEKKTSRRRRGSKKGKTEPTSEVKKQVSGKKEEVVEKNEEPEVEISTEEISETQEITNEQVKAEEIEVSETTTEVVADNNQSVPESTVETGTEDITEVVSDEAVEGEHLTDVSDQQTAETDEKSV